jgi:SAM-dependent methyltransferase
LELPESYRRWRGSRLGQITDALEERLILDLLGPVEGLRVLDFGCGDGVLACTLARRGARVTGLDTDPRMLASALRRAKAESIELELTEGRAEALPFPDASFDRVVGVTALCFVEQKDQAIGEMARVLKPGGRLVIGELGRWSLWALIRRVRGWLGARTWKLASFHTSRELRSLIETHDLTVDRTVGSIYYPPLGLAALLLAPVDTWLVRWTTFGAAFIAVAATKHEPQPASRDQRNPSDRNQGLADADSQDIRTLRRHCHHGNRRLLLAVSVTGEEPCAVADRSRLSKREI